MASQIFIKQSVTCESGMQEINQNLYVVAFFSIAEVTSSSCVSTYTLAKKVLWLPQTVTVRHNIIQTRVATSANMPTRVWDYIALFVAYA